MKLVFCPDCRLVFSLKDRGEECICGASWGRYLVDGKQQATFGGKGIPLGFDNESFLKAVHRYRMDGEHPIAFVAFTIEKDCPTFVME